MPCSSLRRPTGIRCQYLHPNEARDGSTQPLQDMPIETATNLCPAARKVSPLRSGPVPAQLEEAVTARHASRGILPVSALQLMKRAHWDEEQEVWVLQRLSDVAKQRGGAPKRPVSAAGARRPVSAYAKVGVLCSPGGCARGGPDLQSCVPVSTPAKGSETLCMRGALCGVVPHLLCRGAA